MQILSLFSFLRRLCNMSHTFVENIPPTCRYGEIKADQAHITHIALQIKQGHVGESVVFCVTAHLLLIPSLLSVPCIPHPQVKSTRVERRGFAVPRACCFGFCVDTVTTLWPASVVQVVFPLRDWFLRLSRQSRSVLGSAKHGLRDHRQIKKVGENGSHLMF